MLIRLCALLVVLQAACHRDDAPAVDDPPPPTSAQARQTEDLVNKAAALVASKGKAAALAEFRTAGSEWFNGNTYLFAYDMQLNVLLNPAFPQREGTNAHGLRDPNGKYVHDEFVKVVKAKGSGWVDTVFPRPGDHKVVKKWDYVKAVSFDGAPGIIGSGFYLDE